CDLYVVLFLNPTLYGDEDWLFADVDIFRFGDDRLQVLTVRHQRINVVGFVDYYSDCRSVGFRLKCVGTNGYNRAARDVALYMGADLPVKFLSHKFQPGTSRIFYIEDIRYKR